VTSDLAFLLPPPTPEDTALAWKKAGLVKEGPAAAIALRRLPGEADGGPTEAIAAAAITTCQQLGLRPVLVPMQYPADLELAEKVAAHSEVAVVRTRLMAQETLALIAGFDLVIAMRLHALIFAAICGLPPVAISYDSKVKGMMGELGLSVAASAKDFQPSAFAATAAACWQRRETVCSNLDALRAAARRNITLCLQLMEDRA
jgi:polysaccharide pyruvyl transferase WcaK-like protein